MKNYTAFPSIALWHPMVKIEDLESNGFDEIERIGFVIIDLDNNMSYSARIRQCQNV